MSEPRANVYLDYNATTPVAPECIEAIERCLRLGPMNPSSKHSLGERAKALMFEARESVARTFGALPAEVVFTGGGTESNHQAILGALALRPGRRHIVTSEVEHPSTLMLFRHLATQGMRVTFLPVDAEGRLNVGALEDTLTPDTALVSLMWANNETGVLFPVQRAAEMAVARGALFHTDAVQVAGKMAIDFSQVPFDLLSISGHKLHAPAGVGALLVRKGLKLPPLLFGHQERGRRGGTENLAGIVALGVACTLASAALATEPARLQALRDRLESSLLARFPYVSVNGGGAARIANTSNLRFGDLDAESLLDRLDRLGFQASPGAACSSAGTRPSHVLVAMGLSASAALASIRFSFGRENTAADVDNLLQALPPLLDELARHTA